MDLKKAELLAKELIRKHLQSRGSWQFKFDRAKRRFGSCRFNPRRVIYGLAVKYPGGVISLSRSLTELNSETEVKDTILHEIAHALCGPGKGHSQAWKKTARMIGCRGTRCYDSTKVKEAPAKYIAHCPKCGKEHKCDKRTLISCGRCDGKFNPAYRLVFRKNPDSCPSLSE
jgi:predicted SprT family Zn-dependent metalloprotease